MSWVLASQGAQACSFSSQTLPTQVAPRRAGWGCSLELCCSLVNPLRSRALPVEQEDPKLDEKHMKHRGRDPSWLRAPSPFQKCRGSSAPRQEVDSDDPAPCPLPHSLTPVRKAGPTPPTPASDRASEFKFQFYLQITAPVSFSPPLYHLLP